MKSIAIGEAARRSGVKVPTIRYYEQIGLLPPPGRTEGKRRLYEDADLRRLSFIRHARELGFEVDAIRTLLDMQDNPQASCAAADAAARPGRSWRASARPFRTAGCTRPGRAA